MSKDLQCFQNTTLSTYSREIQETASEYSKLVRNGAKCAKKINSLIRVLSKLDKQEDGKNTLRRGKKTLNKKTLEGFVAEALENAKEPMCAPEVLEIIQANGWMCVGDNKLVRVQNTLSRNSNLFKRVSRGYYKSAKAFSKSVTNKKAA